MALPNEDAPPSGTLRLGITPAIGDTLSSGMVCRIKEEFPVLDIRLRTDWGSSLTQQVLDGELDAAFVIRPQGDEVIAPLDYRQIATLELVVVESRMAPRRDGPVSLSSLVRKDWILNPVGCGYRSGLEAAMGVGKGRLRVAVDVYGTEIQLRMIASGMGFGLVPRSILNASLSQSDVKVVEIENFSMKLDVHMNSRGHLGNMKRPSNLFADELAASLSAPFAVTDGQAQVSGPGLSSRTPVVADGRSLP
ncbi:substrate-binding domain-containing protein [Methylobacterium sp. E-046]|uniref:substrate-binding domain-containing protein n=1 Tax=Methylobacterium sp. E-046 TaxID=2836576 RepID=UPI001FBC0189|nr:substrate-binding domain-containing protein [Methylobacterium sp. E-046]MCJ2097602.1 substrate-binding domain-containing protein [Methylobacterium sp. E-046]